MPTGVLGFEAVDDVEKEDYENVLVPAVEAAIAEHGKVRLVYVFGHEFDDFEGEAMWEDVKLGARHPASFEPDGDRHGRRVGESRGHGLQRPSAWPGLALSASPSSSRPSSGPPPTTVRPRQIGGMEEASAPSRSRR